MDAFQTLNLRKNASFLDIGCGKGYVLLCAHQYGFQEIAGIEKSPRLAAIARKNLNRANILAQIYQQDAQAFGDFSSYSVFYMFNPFSERVMQNVVRRILESLENNPRQVDILYANPTCHHLIAPHASSLNVVKGKIAGYKSCIVAYQL